jgi:hypothetical protein
MKPSSATFNADNLWAITGLRRAADIAEAATSGENQAVHAAWTQRQLEAINREVARSPVVVGKDEAIDSAEIRIVEALARKPEILRMAMERIFTEVQARSPQVSIANTEGTPERVCYTFTHQGPQYRQQANYEIREELRLTGGSKLISKYLDELNKAYRYAPSRKATWWRLRKAVTGSYVNSSTEEARNEAFIQELINNTEARRADPERRALQRRAVEAVLANTDWLSATEVSDAINQKARNKHAIASRLLKDKRIFALTKGTENLFASYQFEPTGNPIGVVRHILAALDGYSPFRIAAWFESANSFLDGARPRELLETRAEDVLNAAKAHAEGPMHG